MLFIWNTKNIDRNDVDKQNTHIKNTHTHTGNPSILSTPPSLWRKAETTSFLQKFRKNQPQPLYEHCNKD